MFPFRLRPLHSDVHQSASLVEVGWESLVAETEPLPCELSALSSRADVAGLTDMLWPFGGPSLLRTVSQSLFHNYCSTIVSGLSRDILNYTLSGPAVVL